MALVSVQSYPGHTTHFFLCVWHLSTLTSAYQQFHTTTYIFSFVIISSFLLKKAYAGSFAFLFQFEEIGCRIASNACGGLWPQCFIGNNVQRFAGSMTTILIWVTRSVKIGPGILRTVNCRLFWTRTILNRKKCLPSNWVFLKQLFPCGYMSWGRFKRSENGCRMNWTIGRWSDAKTHAKFCLPDKKVSCSCIELWQAMKRIYFQNPKRKKSWIDPAQPSTSFSRPNRFGRKTVLCVWWDQESSTTNC